MYIKNRVTILTTVSILPSKTVLPKDTQILFCSLHIMRMMYHHTLFKWMEFFSKSFHDSSKLSIMLGCQRTMRIVITFKCLFSLEIKRNPKSISNELMIPNICYLHTHGKSCSRKEIYCLKDIHDTTETPLLMLSEGPGTRGWIAHTRTNQPQLGEKKSMK